MIVSFVISLQSIPWGCLRCSWIVITRKTDWALSKTVQPNFRADFWMAHKPQTAVGRQSSWLYSAEIGAFDSLRDFVLGILERKWAVFSLGSSSKLRRLRFQVHRQIKSKAGRCRGGPLTRQVAFCGSYASPEHNQGTWSVRCGILRSKKWFSKFENLKMSLCNRKTVGNSNSKFLTFGNLFGTAFRWGFDCARFCGVELPSYWATALCSIFLKILNIRAP